MDTAVVVALIIVSGLVAIAAMSFAVWVWFVKKMFSEDTEQDYRSLPRSRRLNAARKLR